MAGYNEMLRRIEPEKIICYNMPFPEMQGDIVYVDYERNSWRHMNYERSYKVEGLEAFKIGGQSPSVYDTIVPVIDVQLKDGGSAYGGKWRPNPNKPADQRYVGTPGEIKTTIMPNGDVFQTKIGPDGKAIMERHHTVHHRLDKHTNPHDHEIRWDTPDEALEYIVGGDHLRDVITQITVMSRTV